MASAEPGAPGVVALADGALAGLGWVEWRDESDGTHLYLLLRVVDPGHRGLGSVTGCWTRSSPGRPGTGHPRCQVHALVEGAFGTSRLGAVPRDFDDYLREVASAPSGIDLWRLLEHDGRWVGAVVNVVVHEVGETPWVAVDPEYRGRGLGERMMLASLGAFAGARVRTAVLTTIAESPYRGVGLYETVGYRATTWLRRYRKRG